MAYEDDIALRDRFLTLLDEVRYGNVPPPLAIKARAAWEATDTFKKEQQAIQEKTDAINSLKSQVLNQWQQIGVPSIGGGLSIDERAQGLAERLYANQITDLKNLGFVNTARIEPNYGGDPTDLSMYESVPASYLTYNGRQIGFLGDIGTAENWQPTGYLQPGNLASWGAQGEGAVGYTVQQAPNGQVYFIPSWGSTSDVSTIAPIATIGLGLLAPGIGNAIGAALAPAASAAVQAAIGSAVIGGTMAEASGGDFLTGALTGAAGSALYPVTSAISETVGSDAIGRALTSGAMAEATGGDFTQAALTGALTGAINEAKLAAAEDYLKSIPPGATYESDLPTLNVVTGDTAGVIDTPVTVDTTFTPDYSLSPVAPVVSEMGAQGIQVPTINQIVDAISGNVDYSLPVPETNVGLTIPEILGSPESFINQPAPNVSVTIPELVAEQPKDISGELAALDAAKALVPLAAGALTAGAVVNAIQEDQPTGFEIVPIPADWRSPEYNMAFTPSAPIDFGSPELIRGTQWERPMSLSTVINTLNQPMIAPEVQQMMTQFQAPSMPYETGINDIIGEIGGRPVSIAEIISGIQSGQNYGS